MGADLTCEGNIIPVRMRMATSRFVRALSIKRHGGAR